MSASSADELAAEGVGALTVEQATAIFSTLVSADEPVVAALPVDWATFAADGRQRGAAMFRSVVGEHGVSSSTDGLAIRLREATAIDRRSMLQALVRDTVADVLRLPAADLDPRRPFGLMGLDSLMALELRNRLERSLQQTLSATLAWNYPTVEALSVFLEALVAPEREDTGAVGPQPVARAVAAEPDVQDLDRMMVELAELSDLSDEDTARALRSAR